MGNETSDEISNRIGAALERDTRVNLHRSPVTVGIENDHIQLEGTMENIAQKRAAVDAAVRALAGHGKWIVDDRLHIEPVKPRADLELKQELEAALSNESSFRDYTLETSAAGATTMLHDAGTTDRVIKASVDHGVITLAGRVQSLSHSRLAEVLTWWADGCCFVDNRLEVFPPEEDTDDEINDAVRIVLEKDPLVHADQIQAGTAAGVVILSGSAATNKEKRLAFLDAWYVPGVSDVVDRITTRS